MMRKFGMILGVAGMVAFIGACSDDSGGTPGKKDGGSIRLDQGGGGGNEGGVPTPDTGGGTDENCTEVMTCVSKCQDATCIAGCISKGTADAQTKANALISCQQNAFQGSCSGDCATPSSSACQACVSAACKTESDACLGGGGTPEAGFGDVCNQTTPCTNASTQCITLQGSTSGNGFCTKSCSNSGGLCPNSPANTQAFCLLGDGSGNNFCAFLCEVQGQKYDCPTGLTCSTTDNPPGSGQFACEP